MKSASGLWKISCTNVFLVDLCVSLFITTIMNKGVGANYVVWRPAGAIARGLPWKKQPEKAPYWVRRLLFVVRYETEPIADARLTMKPMLTVSILDGPWGASILGPIEAISNKRNSLRKRVRYTQQKQKASYASKYCYLNGWIFFQYTVEYARHNELMTNCGFHIIHTTSFSVERPRRTALKSRKFTFVEWTIKTKWTEEFSPET